MLLLLSTGVFFYCSNERVRGGHPQHRAGRGYLHGIRARPLPGSPPPPPVPACAVWRSLCAGWNVWDTICFRQRGPVLFFVMRQAVAQYPIIDRQRGPVLFFVTRQAVAQYPIITTSPGSLDLLGGPCAARYSCRAGGPVGRRASHTWGHRRSSPTHPSVPPTLPPFAYPVCAQPRGARSGAHLRPLARARWSVSARTQWATA